MKKHNWATLFLLCLQVLLSSAVGLEAAQVPTGWGRRDTGLACEPRHSQGERQSNNVSKLECGGEGLLFFHFM